MTDPGPKDPLPVRIALAPIRFYRFFLSPFLGGQCRFHPTCSTYMMQSIRKHGIVRGYVLGIIRLLRCHPWHRGPCMDPVPERFALGRILGYKRRTHRDSANETNGKAP